MPLSIFWSHFCALGVLESTESSMSLIEKKFLALFGLGLLNTHLIEETHPSNNKTNLHS